MPKEFAYIVEPYIELDLDEDHFQDFVVAYYSVCETSSKKNRCTEVRKAIQETVRQQHRVDNELYNPYRNISLNQCFGDSKASASEWLNLTDWIEWS